MKKLFNTPTDLVLIFVIKVIILMALVNVSFWLMNQASTVLFIMGLLLLIASGGKFVENFYKVYINKK